MRQRTVQDPRANKEMDTRPLTAHGLTDDVTASHQQMSNACIVRVGLVPSEPLHRRYCTPQEPGRRTQAREPYHTHATRHDASAQRWRPGVCGPPVHGRRSMRRSERMTTSRLQSTPVSGPALCGAVDRASRCGLWQLQLYETTFIVGTRPSTPMLSVENNLIYVAGDSLKQS